MSNERDGWLNVAQAALWRAEGLAVEWRPRGGFETHVWLQESDKYEALSILYEYRLRPEPREWDLYVTKDGHIWPGAPLSLAAKSPAGIAGVYKVRVREVFE